jgi:hypothetical protein
MAALRVTIATQQSELDWCPRCASRFDPSPSAPLDGVIAHLTRECGGNVHDKGVVTVTSSSLAEWTYDGAPVNQIFIAAKVVADLQTHSVFQSGYRPSTADIPHTANNWVCYDLKDRRVVLTHYSVRSYHVGYTNRNNLTSWLVEMSNDGAEWVLVHRQDENQLQLGMDVTQTFEVSRKGRCRFVRLVQVGRNYHGDDCLAVAGFELFGFLM